MNQPKIAGKKPAVIRLEAGKTVYWCSCGLSKDQPFCDGSHQGTDFQPMEFKAEKTDDYYFCTCKMTQLPPFCDGAHKKIKD